MADEAKIVVVIELDETELKDSLKDLEENSKKTGKKVGENFEKPLQKAFSKDLTQNIKKSNDEIKSFGSGLKTAAFATVGFIALASVLESKFGLISKGLAKVGVSTDQAFSKLQDTTGISRGLVDFSTTVSKAAVAGFGFTSVLGAMATASIATAKTVSILAVGFKAATGIASNFAAITVFLGPLIKNLGEFAKLGSGIGNILLKSKGIFGFVGALSAVSAGLALAGRSLNEFDNNLTKAISQTFIFASVLTGSFAVALSAAIVKISNLANRAGTFLVEKFVAATSAFEQSSGVLDVFVKTVENFDRVTGGAVGTSASWTKEIQNLSEELNLSNNSLTKAAQEIIQVGSQLGLQEDQLKRLTRVTAEYAKINKKDVFDVSVAIVGALNGQSQAVQSLGIKLNEAAVQQFAYKQGVTESIRSLASGEVVQLRYNKLLSQYKNVAGIAAVAAGSLGDQQKRLELNQKRLSTELGRGAALIESNNILASAYNTVLNNVNGTVIAAAGFFGALGARILQIGGFLLGLSFKVFAVIKAIKILNLILLSKVSTDTFAAQLPKIGKSLNDLVSQAAGAEVQITSLKSLISALGKITIKSLDGIARAITGQGLKGLTFFGALRGAALKLIPVLTSFASGIVALLAPFAPLILAVTAIGAGIALLVKAFKVIEERTGALSELWSVLVDVFNEGASVFDPIINAFARISTGIKDLVSQAFGTLIFSLAKVLQGFLALANTGLGRKIFNDEQISRINTASIKLDTLGKNLKNVAFDFRKLGDEVDETSRKIAGSVSKIKPEDFAALQNELKNVGKSQLQILEETRVARQAILKGGLEQNFASQQKFNQLSLLAEIDFNNKKNEILKQQNAEQTRLREESANKILELQEALRDFGATDLERIAFEEQERFDIVNEGLLRGVTSYQEAEDLKNAIMEQGASKRFQIVNKDLIQLNKTINSQLKNGAVRAIAASFAQIGKVLAGADAGFKGFLKVILGIMGDLAISIGTTIIASAFAIDSLKKSLVGSPLAAVALGGALVALGTLLKAKSGGASDGTGAAGGGGFNGGAGGGGFGAETGFTTAEVEREDPQATFSLVVNGDVFDTQDTSRRVLSLFTQAAEDEGVTFENGAFA